MRIVAKAIKSRPSPPTCCSIGVIFPRVIQKKILLLHQTWTQPQKAVK